MYKYLYVLTIAGVIISVIFRFKIFDTYLKLTPIFLSLFVIIFCLFVLFNKYPQTNPSLISIELKETFNYIKDNTPSDSIIVYQLPKKDMIPFMSGMGTRRTIFERDIQYPLPAGNLRSTAEHAFYNINIDVRPWPTPSGLTKGGSSTCKLQY